MRDAYRRVAAGVSGRGEHEITLFSGCDDLIQPCSQDASEPDPALFPACSGPDPALFFYRRSSRIGHRAAGPTPAPRP